MSMIKCPECGKDVSDSAFSCPNCGYPIAQKMKDENNKSEKLSSSSHNPKAKKVMGISIAVVIAVILIVIIVCALTSSSGSSQKSEPGTISISSLISSYNSNAYNCAQKYNGNDYYFYIYVTDISSGYATCAVSGNSDFSGTYLTGQLVYFKNSGDLGRLSKDSKYKIVATIDDFNVYSGSGITRIELKDAELV